MSIGGGKVEFRAPGICVAGWQSCCQQFISALYSHVRLDACWQGAHTYHQKPNKLQGLTEFLFIVRLFVWGGDKAWKFRKNHLDFHDKSWPKELVKWANFLVGFWGSRPFGARVVTTPVFPPKRVYSFCVVNCSLIAKLYRARYNLCIAVLLTHTDDSTGIVIEIYKMCRGRFGEITATNC